MIRSTKSGKVVRKKAAPPEKPAAKKRGRDPEDRVVDPANSKAKREKMLDKTIADSFPASDAPSSLPNPSEDSFSESRANSKLDPKRPRSRDFDYRQLKDIKSCKTQFHLRRSTTSVWNFSPLALVTMN
jgi:hypothetical protein